MEIQERIRSEDDEKNSLEKTVREDQSRSNDLAQIINAANPAPIVFCARSFLYFDIQTDGPSF